MALILDAFGFVVGFLAPWVAAAGIAFLLEMFCEGPR